LGSFDEFAVPEHGVGADQGDEMGCVGRVRAALDGLDETADRHLPLM
jgi:hypothetical protein